MPYGLIILFASVALVAYFDFATEASWMAKAVVSGLFVFSFASWHGWIAVNLLVALSIFIIFYRAWQKARAGK